MAGIEQLEIHSKAYIVRWVKVDAGHTISWSVQPHKKSINFALVKHPGTGGTTLSSHPDDLGGGLEQHTDPGAESKAGLFSKRDVSTAQDQLAKKGFIPIKWHGKCEADKVSVGTYDVTQGGMFGLVFDNTFSKQTSKTATFVLLTYPTGAPPQTARHLPNLQAGPAASTSRSSLGNNTSSPRLGAVTSESVDSLHSHGARARAQSSAGKSDAGPPSTYHVGVLLKRRRKKGQGYARRFFSLDYTTCTLSYYHSRNSSALRGAIPLSLAAVAADERRREITIDSGAEVWHLKASNPKEFADWARALERASKIARGLESAASELAPEAAPSGQGQGEPASKTPLATRGAQQQEEDMEWQHVEALVSRIVGTRDALRRLVKDMAAEKQTPANNHAAYLSPNTPTVPEESDGYFPSQPEKRSFWKRKASGSSSPMTPQSFQPAPPTPAPNGVKSHSGGPREDRDTYDNCAALLKDLDSVVSEFSTLLHTSKRRRIPAHAAAAPRKSMESTASTVEEFFDAEAGDLDKSQVMHIDHQSEEEEEEDTAASDAEEVSIHDSSSVSSIGDEDLLHAGDGAGSLFPTKPKSLVPLPVTDVVARRKTIPSAKVMPPSLIATISMPRMAEQLDQPQHRLLRVAAFAERAIRKPFNPLLGETYELVRSEAEVPGGAGGGGFRLLVEKVSHRPVRLASPAPTQKFWGKSAELTTDGREHYSWATATVFLRNVVMGENNDSTGAKAAVEFRSKGVFGGRGEEVQVEVFGPDGGHTGLSMNGTWTGALKVVPGGQEIWRAGSLVDSAASTYGLTTFAASLNEITPIEKGKLPRLAEQGDLDQAEERRFMEEKGEEYKPRWFEVWRLKGGKDGYWEERAKGAWTGSPKPQRGIRIAIDRGGTFTDCVGNYNGEDIVIKLLSEDPANYSDAPLEGIRRIMAHFLGQDIPRGQPLDTSRIDSIRMGTTVATNALLERKGEKIALVVTKGFGDCLVIGNQSRPSIFDLAIRKPEVLYSTVVEVEERVTLEDYAEDPERTVTKAQARVGSPEAKESELVMGLSGETVRVLQRPERDAVREKLQKVFDSGIKSIAVCMMHAYTFPDHEALVGEVAREIGFQHISLSHELMPMIKLVPRATSVCADAYLTPAIKRYISGFQQGFDGGLGSKSAKREEAGGKGARCEFMQSDGGLVDVDKFTGLRAILSGPAGGVVGYATTSYDEKTKIPVIGFDMGGTSTDVSRYGEGRYDHTFETTTAGVTIQSPQLDINTVAAGGGSMLFFRNGLFVVGPESAGAHPGPACYRKGGPATVTDANLFLGRLLPGFFPKIFGKNEDEGLDPEASRKVLQELADQIHRETGRKMGVDEVAFGFLTVANEAMTRPIRSITEAKGHDTSKHRLATFGGAGGQHAVAIAESLGIMQILIHRYSSVLSAYGMALADVVDERQEPDSTVWTTEGGDVVDQLKCKMEGLKDKARQALRDHGFEDNEIVFEEYLNMRYRGTESALMIVKPSDEDWDFGTAFVEHHRYEFGFTLEGRDIIIDDVRVRGVGKSFRYDEKSVDEQLKTVARKDVSAASRHSEAKVFFEGSRVDTPIYKLGDLSVGDVVKGPAMLADGTQTIVVTPNAAALVLETHVVIDLPETEKDRSAKCPEDREVDPIMLSIFGHRFMAIAEQMGRALQKTSVSTNVKERLDFSCAIFDASGGLVANAPHLPVHLGSMSTLKKGDVIISNHPSYGGTHLPDAGDKILFYAASRAHHADIGGITAGSMPPHSRELQQEGAAIKSEKLVSEGKFDEERYPGCSGTRCLADNINDLRAQGLIAEYGEETVQFYMVAIQNNAEQQVRALLRTVHARFEGKELAAEDFMDDGSPIRLKIIIDPAEGAAVFDFAGTGPEVYGNINAPEAISYSAIIYALRCMISEDIPLNQGCLVPITVRIPPKSLLSPSDNAAVVGGNVLTSQRVTDGDCNNLTFGFGGNVAGQQEVRGFGYYETIAGGSGAGATWEGTDGVHVHMTNTRITDAEVFERRYPVLLREFSIRKGSGGRGQHRGGDGVVRDIEFRIPVQVSILSERRDGQCGLNLWVRKVRKANGGAGGEGEGEGDMAADAPMKAGDRIIVCTPGGGGWGEADATQSWKKGSHAAREDMALQA
ncbi:putative oxysterol binding protein [Staphylotrichum tortipilum]|uniref:Oxysterol binding protein n=1 Tax=Staphylotrichum tortipilum TaxID=2831512 RepID=A0AAN6MN45_9PEZI|nr:putative oxysterol binding protein [Staphylotrichum longicolle]